MQTARLAGINGDLMNDRRDSIGSPIIPEVGVVSLQLDVWGGPWRRRHQVMSRLARYIHVVWCNPLFSWRDAWRKNLYPKHTVTTQGLHFGDVTHPGFTVYQPKRWQPGFRRPASLVRWRVKQQLRKAKQLLTARGCRKTILYIWRPQFELAMDLIDSDLTCYDINDEYTFSLVEQPIGPRERRLITDSDQVIVTSRGLMDKKGNINPHTAFIPHGVDFDAYSSPLAAPDDLAAIPQPRIGYVGVLKRHLDFELVRSVAERHPDWSFVFIGPKGDLRQEVTKFERLSQLANVHMLGGKPVEQLPAYTSNLDIGMMCYNVNDYTNHICPLKLQEYLACGLPVISTAIRSSHEFTNVVRIANSADEWSLALAELLDTAEQDVEARREVARAHDWDNLAFQIVQLLCSRLDPDYAERLAEFSPAERAASPRH